MDDDDYESSSSYSSSNEYTPAISLTNEEIERLINLFKNDINRNCGIFISLEARKNKTQSVKNKQCTINQQNNNNINVEVHNDIEYQIPIDIPKYSNQFFGRKKEVVRLNKILGENKLAIVTGYEGIGKTEFAKCYIEKYFANFQGNIEWINGTSQDSFNHSIAYITNKHHISTDPTEFVEYFKNKNVLFVIDNAYEKIKFRHYFPRSTGVSIIMTSEFAHLNNKKCLFKLSSLTDKEAADVLQSSLGGEVEEYEEEDLKKLARYFDNFPLALQLVGGCLKEEMMHREDMTVKGYFKDLRKKQHLMVQNPLEEDYDKVYLSLRLSIDKIITSEKDSMLALEILKVSVYFGNYISFKALESYEGIKKYGGNLQQSLEVLKKYKLITIEIKPRTKEIQIHNLIARLLLEQQNMDGTSKKYFKLALGLLGSMGLYNIKYMLRVAIDFIEILVEYILENNLFNLLETLVENGHDKILDHLLLSLPDPTKIIEEYDLLSKAIDHQQISAVKVLIKHNADVNRASAKLRVPLHKASKKCTVAIILCLLAAGADANAEDYKSNTPLHTVVGIGYKETKNENNAIQCTDALIRNGADINARNIDGNTALVIALENKALKLALFLLQHQQISVKLYNLYKESPLRKVLDWDITEEHEELQALKVIRTLLLSGANKNEIDFEGRNLLSWAVENNCLRITQFLIEECAINVDHQDVNGQTPLHKALNRTIATKKFAQITIGIVRTLIEHHARTDIKDNDGFTAYELSQQHGHVKMCLFAQFLNHELKGKKKKVFYLPDKNHRKPEKRSYNPSPFKSSRAIGNNHSRKPIESLQISSNRYHHYLNWVQPQVSNPPPSLPGPSYNILRLN